MLIGKAARLAGVNIQTLRYYERVGLIKKPPRQPSGYRDYSDDTVKVVRLIKWSQRLGFSLAEVRSLLSILDRHERNGAVRALARAKVRDLAARIDALRAMSQALESVMSCTCRGNCPILRSVMDGHQPFPMTQLEARRR